MKDQRIGVFAFEQGKGKNSAEGHHLVVFIRLPRTEQGEWPNGRAWEVGFHRLDGVSSTRLNSVSSTGH